MATVYRAHDITNDRRSFGSTTVPDRYAGTVQVGRDALIDAAAVGRSGGTESPEGELQRLRPRAVEPRRQKAGTDDPPGSLVSAERECTATRQRHCGNTPRAATDALAQRGQGGTAVDPDDGTGPRLADAHASRSTPCSCRSSLPTCSSRSRRMQVGTRGTSSGVSGLFPLCQGTASVLGHRTPRSASAVPGPLYQRLRPSVHSATCPRCAHPRRR